ncbi:uncharacterized protein LOC130591664 [Beta vulgaris subsp. vulgaris]|uniref:uncharacterized protein LOC130591664 n=1 Tax=Beta vulgaris subsp. vulgaris TaxID=3555 RepID=UPI0025493F97|nr:uncharacterized protein LOC130591664 [Beta vulgaris subsp. vulgaris]
MSDQSDSQNSLGINLMTESEPSSPSLHGGSSSSDSSPPDGRTRLLADLPLTSDREKELRSKFLNDRSSPELANLTTQFLTARMSGDNQTLKELRHQILARRTLRHPPPDAVPGLDVQPLREHAWLESLADAGVVTDPSVFDRLARDPTPSHPSHPPVVNLGSDSDSIASMEHDAPSSSGRDHESRPSQFDVGESSAMPSSPRPEVIPPGQMSFIQGNGCQWTIVTAQRRPLFARIGGDEGETRIPRVWLPHAKYILGNEPLSAVFLCRTHPEGDVSLDLEELGLDDKLQPMAPNPDEPLIDYDTIHGLTGGPRGTDRNPGRGNRAGRTARRAGRTQGRGPGRGESTPSRSTIQVPINRGGSSTSRRRPREPEIDAPNKRQSVEVNSTDLAVNDNQGLSLSPVREPAPGDQQFSDSLARSKDAAVGSSCSTRQRVYEMLSRPTFLSDLGPGIFCRAQEWIETNIVPLCASVKAALSHPPSVAGRAFRPALDVREDESIFADIPANGGTLGYRLLKGLQLPFDRPADKLVAPAAQLAHDLVVAGNSAVELIAQYLEYQRLAESAGGTIQGLEADKVGLSAQISQLEASLESEKNAKAEADKELGELRLKAKELEDLRLKNSNLETALKASQDEKETAVKEAAAEANQVAVRTSRGLRSSLAFSASDMTGAGWPLRGVSATPIQALIGSRWKSPLARAFTGNL